MAWTYNPTLSSNRDLVRFSIGDTDENESVTLQNEEITALLVTYTTVSTAAAYAAEYLALRYARKATLLKDDAGASKQYGDRAAAMRELATTLRGRSSLLALPYAGGISASDKVSREGDTDRVSPAFTKALHDDLSVGP